MTDTRPPLDAFDDAVVASVADEAAPADGGDVDAAGLRELVARHQERVRDLPGVEDIVYEWRSQFHEDPLVHRTAAVYVLVHRPHVWAEFGEALDISESQLDTLRQVHARQAESILGADAGDRLSTGEPMVLVRP